MLSGPFIQECAISFSHASARRTLRARHSDDEFNAILLAFLDRDNARHAGEWGAGGEVELHHDTAEWRGDSWKRCNATVAIRRTLDACLVRHHQIGRVERLAKHRFDVIAQPAYRGIIAEPAAPHQLMRHRLDRNRYAERDQPVTFQ